MFYFLIGRLYLPPLPPPNHFIQLDISGSCGCQVQAYTIRAYLCENQLVIEQKLYKSVGSPAQYYTLYVPLRPFPDLDLFNVISASRSDIQHRRHIGQMTLMGHCRICVCTTFRSLGPFMTFSSQCHLWGHGKAYMMCGKPTMENSWL